MTSKLAAMQARFQQKQMQEKEEKLLRLYENQQQRAFDRVGRNSAGSNSSVGSTGGGKVRQLFEERRKAGVDKSYPLEPINGKINGKIGVTSRFSNGRQPVINSRKNIETTVQRSVIQVKNGKPTVNKRETVRKIYNNNNGVEKFEENRYDENFLNSPNNLVDMMNRHNIYDNLEDEESPPLDDGDDEVYFGKLSNVGGKPPSQNRNVMEKMQENPVKNVVRKSPVNTKTPINQKSNPSSRAPSRKSSDSSPQHSTEKQMSQRTAFTPSTNKPSSRQAAPRVATCPVTRDDLQECAFCSRRFATDRIKKHEDVCRQTCKKQRKTYDAFKHRVQGTELEQFTGGGKKKSSRMVAKKPAASSTATAKKNNWRRTHEEFIATIRSAKMAQAHVAGGGKLSDLPPPPPTTNPDYVQCPHCGRRFNEAAAARHIPKCASYEFNKPKTGAAKKR